MIDGTIDLSGGVNSIKVPTVQSERVQGGLHRNELAWLINGAVRDGGIRPRFGWLNIGNIFTLTTGRFQGAHLYAPNDGTEPYFIMAIAGRIYKVPPDNPSGYTDLSSVLELTMPDDQPYTYFAQAEEFLVIQAGDYVTLPLIWDGTLLRRSNGVRSFGIVPPTYTIVLKNLSAVPGQVIPPRSTSLPVGPATSFTVQIGPIKNNESVTVPGLTQVIELNAPYTGIVGDTFGMGCAINEVFVAGKWTVMAFDNTPGSENITARNETTWPTNPFQAGQNGYFGSFFPQNRLPAGGSSVPVFTAQTQIGPTSAAVTVPAINSNVTIPLLSPATSIPGDIVGFANSSDPNAPGQWQVVSYTETEGIVPELPAAGPMDYFMGRLWYAIGNKVMAGDIVNGDSGTSAYNFRDSVLKVTENPLIIGGDGFAVAGNDGNVRAIRHSANIDASLGQGRLYIFTRKAVYALQVPVTRTDWINADYSNQPLMTVVQLVNGSVNDRSVVPVNGDLFYRSFEPGIRSLITAVRNFSQWGNIEISANEQRLMRLEDRSLLYASSGVFFNNRLLETGFPVDTNYGVAFQAIAPMDFLPVSGFNQQAAPVWEGMYQGLNILQLAAADFGGRERCFIIAGSDLENMFQIWEITDFSRRDNIDSRITFQFESPAFTWGDEATLKRLIGGELWVDQLSGTVNFKVEYRPDSDSCWHLWHLWEECSVANSCEDPDVGICYPTTAYPDTYRATMVLPRPTAVCTSATGRPSDIAYQFQIRVTIVGWCRVRGFWLHASPFERSLYSRMTC